MSNPAVIAVQDTDAYTSVNYASHVRASRRKVLNLLLTSVSSCFSAENFLKHLSGRGTLDSHSADRSDNKAVFFPLRLMAFSSVYYRWSHTRWVAAFLHNYQTTRAVEDAPPDLVFSAPYFYPVAANVLVIASSSSMGSPGLDCALLYSPHVASGGIAVNGRTGHVAIVSEDRWKGMVTVVRRAREVTILGNQSCWSTPQMASNHPFPRPHLL